MFILVFFIVALIVPYIREGAMHGVFPPSVFYKDVNYSVSFLYSSPGYSPPVWGQMSLSYKTDNINEEMEISSI